MTHYEQKQIYNVPCHTDTRPHCLCQTDLRGPHHSHHRQSSGAPAGNEEEKATVFRVESLTVNHS